MMTLIRPCYVNSTKMQLFAGGDADHDDGDGDDHNDNDEVINFMNAFAHHVQIGKKQSQKSRRKKEDIDAVLAASQIYRI